jgi:hypothetical protein
MQKLKKLFGAFRADESSMTALSPVLVEKRLARLSHYQDEILAWHAKREQILGDLEQRQQGLKEDIAQLQEIEDPVTKRYTMKSLLQQWRDTCLKIDYQHWRMNIRISTLTTQFTQELFVLASSTPWRKQGDKVKLMHDSVLVVIDELIGIYERLDDTDTRAKPDLARNIEELIAVAAALDARSVRAHTKIVHFRKESAYLRLHSSLPRRIIYRHSLRHLPIARHQ